MKYTIVLLALLGMISADEIKTDTPETVKALD